MIELRHNHPIDLFDVICALDSSGNIRPTKDFARTARMFSDSNLIISGWSRNTPAGICRALTDYSYCYYLSRLTVARVMHDFLDDINRAMNT